MLFLQTPHASSHSHGRPPIPPAPTHNPAPRPAPLHQLAHRPVPHAGLLQRVDDGGDAGELADHRGVPLDAGPEMGGLGDHACDEGGFAAAGHHLGRGARAGAVCGPGFLRGGSEEVAGGRVEGGVAEGKVDAGES